MVASFFGRRLKTVFDPKSAVRVTGGNSRAGTKERRCAPIAVVRRRLQARLLGPPAGLVGQLDPRVRGGSRNASGLKQGCMSKWSHHSKFG